MAKAKSDRIIFSVQPELRSFIEQQCEENFLKISEFMRQLIVEERTRIQKRKR